MDKNNIIILCTLACASCNIMGMNDPNSIVKRQQQNNDNSVTFPDPPSYMTNPKRRKNDITHRMFGDDTKGRFMRAGLGIATGTATSILPAFVDNYMQQTMGMHASPYPQIATNAIMSGVHTLIQRICGYDDWMRVPYYITNLAGSIRSLLAHAFTPSQNTQTSWWSNVWQSVTSVTAGWWFGSPYSWKKPDTQYNNIHDAVAQDDYDAVKTLIEHENATGYESGINKFDTMWRYGKTPLYTAIDQSNPRIVKLLLNNGADIQCIKYSQPVNCPAIDNDLMIEDDTGYSQRHAAENMTAIDKALQVVTQRDNANKDSKAKNATQVLSAILQHNQMLGFPTSVYPCEEHQPWPFRRFLRSQPFRFIPNTADNILATISRYGEYQEICRILKTCYVNKQTILSCITESDFTQTFDEMLEKNLLKKYLHNDIYKIFADHSSTRLEIVDVIANNVIESSSSVPISLNDLFTSTFWRNNPNIPVARRLRLYAAHKSRNDWGRSLYANGKRLLAGICLQDPGACSYARKKRESLTRPQQIALDIIDNQCPNVTHNDISIMHEEDMDTIVECLRYCPHAIRTALEQYNDSTLRPNDGINRIHYPPDRINRIAHRSRSKWYQEIIEESQRDLNNLNLQPAYRVAHAHNKLDTIHNEFNNNISRDEATYMLAWSAIDAPRTTQKIINHINTHFDRKADQIYARALDLVDKDKDEQTWPTINLFRKILLSYPYLKQSQKWVCPEPLWDSITNCKNPHLRKVLMPYCMGNQMHTKRTNAALTNARVQ